VTVTDVIRHHLTMALKIIDQFPAEQRKELKKYSQLIDRKKKNKKGGGGGGGGAVGFSDGSILEVNGINEASSSTLTSPTTIPFKIISILHKTLAEHFSNPAHSDLEVEVGAFCPYLHEVLRGSTLHIPELPTPKRNPELEARCQKLKLQQQERDYQQMVTNVSASTLSTTSDLASEFSKAAKTTSSALIVVVNIFLTVVAAFFFGFFASRYVLPTPSLAAEALVGVVMATVVAVADLYFLIRSGF